MKAFRNIAWAVLLSAMAAATSAAATAKVNLVQNGGFENPVWDLGPDAGQPAATPLALGAHTYLKGFGWGDTSCDCLSYVLSPGQQLYPNDSMPATPSPAKGDYFATDSSIAYDKGTYLYQTLSGLTAGQTYTLGFYQAGASYYQNIPGNQAQWQVDLGGSIDWTDAGGWALSGATSTRLAPVMTLDSANGSPWTHQTMAFTATAPSELLTFFATNGPASTPPFALLDGVSVTAGVPEPGAWALMIIGVGGVGAMARLRRRNGLAAA